MINKLKSLRNLMLKTTDLFHLLIINTAFEDWVSALNKVSPSLASRQGGWQLQVHTEQSPNPTRTGVVRRGWGERSCSCCPELLEQSQARILPCRNMTGSSTSSKTQTQFSQTLPKNNKSKSHCKMYMKTVSHLKGTEWGLRRGYSDWLKILFKTESDTF